ncbi:MAG: Rrf2 family transcriptional regulator [Alphaproteobacteria bacterium]|uniref:Rrf2 family transcriptional regulator n=1 Tax=Candidatus Nitrobium versatile TaxID=2884831 RepID=A0A953JAW3_9BACT|nr:Rrf2 family transcriptional regulator [Candidatus Nitrobium versatile]
MEITRETDYAIRCVLYLSGKQEEVTMVDEIAREMSVPKSFLAKILQKLVRSKVAKSYRGVKGGFQLAKRPAEISLLDVIETVQGPVAMNRCAVDESICNFSAACVVHPVWVDLRRKVEEYLKDVTFEMLRTGTCKCPPRDMLRR